MKVLLHAPSARLGGALNYILAVSPKLAAAAPDCEFVALLPGSTASHVPHARNFRVLPVQESGSLGRMWYDQGVVRRLLRTEKIDVFFATANTGMLAPPCRQVLLVRNSLYFSKLYEERVLPIKGRAVRAAHVLRRNLVRLSIQSSDVVMTPSQSMMDEVRQVIPFPDSKALVNRYGVDPQRFSAHFSRSSGDCPTLLFTGLYSEHKNLGTLFDAMLELIQAGIPCQLVTPADPRWEASSVNIIREQDTGRAKRLTAANRVRFTGVLPGQELVKLYAQADIFVYPCAVESFGHPLLEAMAAGLPVVAADTQVNRELCGDAALYFSSFDSQECADRIATVLRDRELRELLRSRGIDRVSSFDWETHVRNLLVAFGVQQPQVSA